MLDYLVLYQSETGNTKKIAATIFAHLPGNSKDLIDLDAGKDIPEAQTYFIGFCVHRGSCSMAVSDILSSLSGKNIALFATCGMGNSPDYYQAIEKNASAWIEDDNQYLGAFSSAREKCQEKYARNTRPCAAKKTPQIRSPFLCWRRQVMICRALKQLCANCKRRKSIS